ncbi:hypothetical protein BH24ACT5_BH24ACT5_17700 [soil metagenome]
MNPAGVTPPRVPAALDRLEPGQRLLVGSDRFVTVDAELATAFAPGDRLIVVPDTGDLLHIPADQYDVASTAVRTATAAFADLAQASDESISAFFDHAARRLDDDSVMAPVLSANVADVDRARAADRSTTRLVLSDGMRADMAAGLRGWRDSRLRRDEVVETIGHEGWSVDARRAPLGVVGFVFEGRPNVFADAAGVVRTGNTVVMRIGSDALGTAEAIMLHVIGPALADAGLPEGTMQLVASPARAAGWALFAQPELDLAVARGSGPAVTQLGSVARQSGTPVSLHGTGGAWLVAGRAADATWFAQSVVSSLDRKVCNTLNVCCIPRYRLDLVPVFLDAIDAAAAALDTHARLHVELASRPYVPNERFDRVITVRRADGDREEPAATDIDRAELGTEWEWEGSPELTLVVTADVAEAVELCNRHSPRFVASLVSDDDAEQEAFYASVDAPFVGNAFTRWVDGQYALSAPELGLSNWQSGRLLARGAVLSGASVHTIRHRATVHDLSLHR